MFSRCRTVPIVPVASGHYVTKAFRKPIPEGMRRLAFADETCCYARPADVPFGVLEHATVAEIVQLYVRPVLYPGELVLLECDGGEVHPARLWRDVEWPLVISVINRYDETADPSTGMDLMFKWRSVPGCWGITFDFTQDFYERNDMQTCPWRPYFIIDVRDREKFLAENDVPEFISTPGGAFPIEVEEGTPTNEWKCSCGHSR
jgi:hypothetical protein